MSPLSPSGAGRYTATDKRAEKAGRASPQLAGVKSHSFFARIVSLCSAADVKSFASQLPLFEDDNKTVWISVNRRERQTRFANERVN